MASFSVAASLLGTGKLASFIGAVLLLCILLEVVWGFCVGCVMYAWWIKIKG